MSRILHYITLARLFEVKCDIDRCHVHLELTGKKE
jgi:hypothetical protein